MKVLQPPTLTPAGPEPWPRRRLGGLPRRAFAMRAVVRRLRGLTIRPMKLL